MAVSTRAGSKSSAFIGAVFFVFGAAALAGCVYWVSSIRNFVATAEHAKGRVIALVPHRDNDGTTYAPTVQYVAKDGQERTFTSSTSSNPPSHREGDLVDVLYDPARVEKAEIDSFWDLWLGPLIAGILGAVFTLVGAAVCAQGVRESMRRRRMIENGLHIQAAFDGVERTDGGYAVLAKATDTRGVPRVFHSPTLMADPGPKLAGRSSIEVVVDPDDWGTYDMNMEFLT